MTRKRKRALIVAASISGLALGGAAIAGATGAGDDGSDKPITGPALERASRVALDRTGGGRVSATEVGDEEGYYEVEVTRGDGSQVDVHLDRNFNVIDKSADSSGDEESSSTR
jgi:uncharacterized membrane protein YkoI